MIYKIKHGRNNLKKYNYLKVTTWNINGEKEKKLELKELLDPHNVDVNLIKETSVL